MPVLVTVSDGAEDVTATLSITVTDRNEIPVAHPDSFVIDEGEAFRGALFGSDADGDSLVVEIVSAAAKGQVTLLHPITGRFSLSVKSSGPREVITAGSPETETSSWISRVSAVSTSPVSRGLLSESSSVAIDRPPQRMASSQAVRALGIPTPGSSGAH